VVRSTEAMSVSMSILMLAGAEVRGRDPDMVEIALIERRATSGRSQDISSPATAWRAFFGKGEFPVLPPAKAFRWGEAIM
jgi:hypothetical protein